MQFQEPGFHILFWECGQSSLSCSSDGFPRLPLCLREYLNILDSKLLSDQQNKIPVYLLVQWGLVTLFIRFWWAPGLKCKNLCSHTWPKSCIRSIFCSSSSFKSAFFFAGHWDSSKVQGSWPEHLLSPSIVVETAVSFCNGICGLEVNWRPLEAATGTIYITGATETSCKNQAGRTQTPSSGPLELPSILSTP